MRLLDNNYIKMTKKILRRYFEFIYNFNVLDFRIDTNNLKFKPSILVITHEMTKTGAPLLILHIVKKIESLGWNVIVVSKSAGPLAQEFKKYAQVFICNNPNSFSNKIEILTKLNVKFALVNSVVSGDWSRKLKSNGFNILSLVHEMPEVIKAWSAEGFAKDIANYSNWVIFPSMYVKDKFDGIVNQTYDYKIMTQGLYLKSDFQISKDKAKEYINKYLGLNGNPIVLNVATGNYRKGFDIFVEMAIKQHDINFIWVGDIDQIILKNVKQRHEIKNIPNLNLAGYVNDLKLLTSLYSASSVLALTSREEPFGSIVLEAMHSGTPIVAFKGAGGFQDVVKDDETGYLVEFENYNEMLNKIKYIISNKDVQMRLYKQTKVVSSKYDFDSYVINILELYTN